MNPLKITQEETEQQISEKEENAKVVRIQMPSQHLHRFQKSYQRGESSRRSEKGIPNEVAHKNMFAELVEEEYREIVSTENTRQEEEMQDSNISSEDLPDAGEDTNQPKPSFGTIPNESYLKNLRANADSSMRKENPQT